MVKKTFVDGETVIDAAFLNSIQAEIEKIGEVTDLQTERKGDLVDAVNWLAERSVRSVNGKQSNRQTGNVDIGAEDILLQIPKIQFQGTLQQAMDMFATDTGGPTVRGVPGADVSYEGSNARLPTIRKSDHAGSGKGPEGKGTQIVFIPGGVSPASPTLSVNGGEAIEIRRRSARAKNGDDQSPDATEELPAGCLMNGVPYTLTFCGKYWLVDSYVPFDSVRDVTAEYAAWTESAPPSANSLQNFLMTLPDGTYRLVEDGDLYCMRRVTSACVFCWIERYNERFCYISLYADEDEILYFSTEESILQIEGSTLATQEYVNQQIQQALNARLGG